MTPADRADFKKRYGLEMPKRLDPKRLTEPAMNKLAVWRMDTYTELLRTMHARAQKLSPGALTYAVTAPSQYQVAAYNDLEKMSEFLGTTNSDLYSASYNFVRAGMQHIRGAQGNRRPVLSTSGCLVARRAIRANIVAHLMNGANALWPYTVQHRRSMAQGVEETVPYLRMLRDTPLGRALARSRLVRYAAVLNERAAFLDDIRRGALAGDITVCQARVRRRGSMRNIPLDAVYASHLADEIADYRVLIVPSGRKMSDASAKTIARWVRGGGRLIVEGESIRTPAFASLASVRPGSDNAQPQGAVNGLGGALAGREFSTASALVPVTPGKAQVLAKAGDSPVVTRAAAGKGAVVFVALLDAPNELIEPLVREMGGPLPCELDAASNGSVRLSAATDGRTTTVMLYNEHFADARDVTVALRDIAPAGRRLALNVSDGTQMEVADTLSLRLGPGRAAFVILLPPEQAKGLPKPGPALGPPAYAPSAGMEFLRLEARKKAVRRRARKAGTVYVAVFNNLVPAALRKSPPDYGETAIRGALVSEPGVEAEFIENLAPETLASYDVLVMPNMQTRGTNWPRGWEPHVRQFVANGGGALLVHHCVGFGEFSGAAFPEIGSGPTYVKVRGMKVVAEHPVVNAASVKAAFPREVNDPAFLARFKALELPVGATFQSGFPDYVKIAPGPQGQVIVKSLPVGGAGDDPALVAGRVGKGRVVLSGMNLGCRCLRTEGGWKVDEVLSPPERSILVNSIFWLAGR